MKTLWRSMVGLWLAIKRLVLVLWGYGLRFEPDHEALLVHIRDGQTRRGRTIRIPLAKIDDAIRRCDRQVIGGPVVFNEGDRWALVPGYLVPELRAYLVMTRDAIARGRGGATATSAPAAKGTATKAP